VKLQLLSPKNIESQMVFAKKEL